MVHLPLAVLGVQQVFTVPLLRRMIYPPNERKEVRPVSELWVMCVGALVAVIIAKQFIKAVEKEISAHDGRNIKGGDDNR